jgi:hypothetical protein
MSAARRCHYKLALEILPTIGRESKEDRWQHMCNTNSHLAEEPLFRTLFDAAYEEALIMQQEYELVAATQDECML